MTEVIRKTERGAIIYDADLFDQVSVELFQPRHWESATLVTGTLRSAGRGNTLIVNNGSDEFVLRKFVRGGLIGRLIKNTYFWSGEDSTRSFLEWRMLRKMRAMGLNVPRPAAGQYRRTAMFYTADLLTVRIPGIRSLAERLTNSPAKPEFWQALGVAIGAVHQAGVFHADLNAYNVQLDQDDELWLLDFDRGRILPPGTWMQQTLNRLHRSLQKIRHLSSEVNFTEFDWSQFLEGYFSASRSE